MNLDSLNERLENQEVKYDFKGNPVHVGDIVIFMGSYKLEIDIVKKICPTGIKVLGNSFKTYSSNEICRAENLLNDQEILDLRKKYSDEKKKMKLVDRNVIFCYKDFNGDVGLGTFSFTCENKKTSFASEIKKHIDNNPNKEIYFINRKNGEIYIDIIKNNNISKDLLIVSDSHLGFDRYYKSKEIFETYISKDKKETYKKLIYETKIHFDNRYFYRDKLNEKIFDEDFLFLKDKNASWRKTDEIIYSSWGNNSGYISEITELKFFDNRDISEYKKYDSYIKMFKDFFDFLLNNK